MPYGSSQSSQSTVQFTVQSVIAFVLIGAVILFLVAIVVMSYLKSSSEQGRLRSREDLSRELAVLPASNEELANVENMDEQQIRGLARRNGQAQGGVGNQHLYRAYTQEMRSGNINYALQRLGVEEEGTLA